MAWAIPRSGDPVYDAKTHSVVGRVGEVDRTTFRVEWNIAPVGESYVVRFDPVTGRRVDQHIPTGRGKSFKLAEMP